MLMLIFQVGSQQFALNTEFVIEVLPALKLQQVHGASNAIAGLFNYQGQIVPVININLLFDEPSPEPTLKQRIILLRQNSPDQKSKLVGLLVDNITEATSMALSELDSDDNVAELFKNPYLGHTFINEHNDIMQWLLPDSILSDQEYHELVAQEEIDG